MSPLDFGFQLPTNKYNNTQFENYSPLGSVFSLRGMSLNSSQIVQHGMASAKNRAVANVTYLPLPSWLDAPITTDRMIVRASP